MPPTAMALDAPRLSIITNYPGAKLLDHGLFKTSSSHLTHEQSIRLRYQRARAIVRLYNFTIEDCQFMTPKFWQLHRDSLCSFDLAAATLVTIQLNLVAGLLAPYAMKRDDLRPLIKRILNFEISAQYLMTEVAHGLDAINVETTATLLSNGDFDLNTPHMGAAKWMPPSTPVRGFQKMGIVIAKLLINGEDHGLRPFIVDLNDGEKMMKGVTSKILPRRAGSRPIDHALTIFEHVRLSSTALLGTLEKPANRREHFLAMIWRIPIGGVCISIPNIPALKASVYILGKYSLRRHIYGADQKPVPIISFRTQQRPILHALAHIAILEAYADDVIRRFTEEKSTLVRDGLGTAFKVHALKVIQSSLVELSERCGAQGLYEFNQIIENQLEGRGASIAEGDVLTTSIRLASEILIGRYSLPPPNDPDCLLARHEIGLFKEAASHLAQAQGHRSDHSNRYVLPLCLPLIQAIGHRMAYEAAVTAGVHRDFLALYEAGIIMSDSGWYIENVGMTRAKERDMEERALSALLPHLESLLEQLGIKEYVYAPIVSEESWNKFVGGLKSSL